MFCWPRFGSWQSQAVVRARPRRPNNLEVAAADFCEEHQIAESMCPYCDPSLIESLGFCGGHGVPEAFCYQCNPALIPAFKSVGDWCAGHDRPESQCYICNPELDPEKQPDALQRPQTGTRRATSPGGSSLLLCIARPWG